MSELQKKHKQLKRLRIRNITLNTVCILLALAGISWTINYFWKYVHYEITNDAVVDQYIAPLNIRASGYIKEVRFTEHQPVHAGDTLLILDTSDTLMKHLLDNRYKILSCLTFRYLINIHKYCNKRCLSICCHKRDNLVLNYLNTTVNFFLYTLFCDNIDLLLCYRDSCLFHLLANHTTEFLTADLHKRCKMCQ